MQIRTLLPQNLHTSVATQSVEWTWFWKFWCCIHHLDIAYTNFSIPIANANDLAMLSPRSQTLPAKESLGMRLAMLCVVSCHTYTHACATAKVALIVNGIKSPYCLQDTVKQNNSISFNMTFVWLATQVSARPFDLVSKMMQSTNTITIHHCPPQFIN